MPHGYRPYNTPLARQVTERKAARHEFYTWLCGSLVVSLLPFGAVAIAYRLFVEVHKTHHFPSWPALLGRGELLLIVLSITGATAGEIISKPKHLSKAGKRMILMLTLLVGAAALTLFTVTGYDQLAHSHLALDRESMMVVSVIMLTLVIVIQTITLLTRPFELGNRT